MGKSQGVSGQSSPDYGAVNVIAVHPTNANILMIGLGEWRRLENHQCHQRQSHLDAKPLIFSIRYRSARCRSIGVCECRVCRHWPIQLAGRTGGIAMDLYVSSNGGASFGAGDGECGIQRAQSNISSVAANGLTFWWR